MHEPWSLPHMDNRPNDSHRDPVIDPHLDADIEALRDDAMRFMQGLCFVVKFWLVVGVGLGLYVCWPS